MLLFSELLGLFVGLDPGRDSSQVDFASQFTTQKVNDIYRVIRFLYYPFSCSLNYERIFPEFKCNLSAFSKKLISLLCSECCEVFPIESRTNGVASLHAEQHVPYRGGA